MDLKSLNYVIFVTLVSILYLGLYRVKYAQKIILAIANSIFILSVAGLKPFILIIALILFSFSCGIWIERMINERRSLAHFLLIFNISVLILVLCYFKFFIDSYSIIGDLVVPIGISYYTLTMIAYSHDIFHQKHRAEKNIIDFYTFITFFPSIIQGPINLYKKISPQLKTPHKPEAQRIYKGIQRSLWGYIKKVVIADRIGLLVVPILQDETVSGFYLLFAMILYSFQIYTDFSGGIDVIMGVCEIFDIHPVENFRSPLVSRSVTEYWQRWHISLGEFMEKYIYYPIVLNRKIMKLSKKIPYNYFKKVFSATLASVIVFIIVGIWHGTGWNYVIYGGYQAIFVASAVLFSPLYRKVKHVLRINEVCISWKLFQIIRTFIILTIGRFFIRANNLSQAVILLKRTFLNYKWSDIHILFDDTLSNYGLDPKNIFLIYSSIILIVIVDILHERKIEIRHWLMKQDIVFRYFVYLCAIFVIIIFGIYGPEFNSSTFIYQGF